MKPLLALFLLANIFICSCCQPDQIVLKGTLPVDTAKKLVRNFDERVFRRPGKVGFDDARSVWFSREQLSSLLKKITCEKGDGVRIYLAAYNADCMPSPKYNTNYQDHTTLIMVSTFDTIVIRDSKPVHKHWDYYGKRGNSINAGAILTSDPENQGEMCPPPTPCSLEGATLYQ